MWELEKFRSCSQERTGEMFVSPVGEPQGRCYTSCTNTSSVGNEGMVDMEKSKMSHNTESLRRERRLKVFNDKHVADGLVSVLFSRKKDVRFWDENDISTIVNVSHLFCDNQEPLLASQNHSCISKLPKIIRLFDTCFQITFWKFYSGDLGNIAAIGYEKNRNVPSISFESTLKRSLQRGFSGVLISLGDYMCSVINSESCFYIFDPQIEKISCFANIAEIYEHCCALVRSRIMPGNAEFVVTSLSVNITPYFVEGNESGSDEEENVSGRSSPMLKNESHAKNEVEQNIPSKSSESQDVVCEPHILLFQPLIIRDRDILCARLNFVNEYKGEDCYGCSAMGEIVETYPVVNDNDAFFRAISYAISGTELNHRRLRLQVVRHIQNKESVFKPFLHLEYSSISQYLNETGMKYLGTPATELEMYGIADLLETDVHVLNNAWMQYSFFDGSRQNPQVKGGIYLRWCNQSFEVVLKIKSEERSGEAVIPGNQPQHIPIPFRTQQEASHEVQVGDSSLSSCSIESSESCSGESQLKTEARRGKKSGNKVDYNAKRRKQAYDKYWNNEEYRMKKRAEARNRYRFYGGCLNEIIHDTSGETDNLSEKPNLVSKKKKQSDRYRNDEEYRKKKLQKAWERYHSDVSHREKKKVYNKTKYHEDEEYRERVRKSSRKNYEKNKREKGIGSPGTWEKGIGSPDSWEKGIGSPDTWEKGIGSPETSGRGNTSTVENE